MKKILALVLAVALCFGMSAPAFASGNLFFTCTVELDCGVKIEFETVLDDLGWVALDTSGARFAEILRVKPNTSMKVTGSLNADVHTLDYSAEYYDADLDMIDYAYMKSGTVSVVSGKVETLFRNVDDVYASLVNLGTVDGIPTLVSYYDVPYAWTENPFTDVSPDDDFYMPVMWARYYEVTNGTSKTTFSPDGTCTRGQVVTFLWRACGCPEPLSIKSPFTDVKPTDYFYKPVLWAIEEGITLGTSATTFSPEQTCQYSHVLTFLWRALGTPMPLLSGSSNPFGKEYWSEPFEFVYEYGLIDPDQDPAAPCPRFEIVNFLYWILPF